MSMVAYKLYGMCSMGLSDTYNNFVYYYIQLWGPLAYMSSIYQTIGTIISSLQYTVWNTYNYFLSLKECDSSQTTSILLRYN